MPTCQGKLINGDPCTNPVEKGQKYCSRWHDPEDESWRLLYSCLERVTAEEKTELLLRLIEEHPEHRLVLPKRDGLRADLEKIDLSLDTLAKWRKQARYELLSWWSTETGGADLGYADLRGANLRNANLQGAYLGHANLHSARLGKAMLQDARLLRANLQGAHLWRANLQGARLLHANLRGARLTRADLEDADLGDAILRGTDFRGAILQGASLLGADVQNANLRHANLHRADFGFAKLKGADLRLAELQGVDLSVVRDMSNVYISGAWLDRTRIRQEKLGGALGEERRRIYLAAKRGYIALKQNFDDLGDYGAASWAYIKERQMEKATKAPWRCRKYYGDEQPLPTSVREKLGSRWPQTKEWKYASIPWWSPLVWWFWLKYGVQWASD